MLQKASARFIGTTLIKQTHRHLSLKRTEREKQNDKMITKEQRDLTAAILKHARENNPDLDPHTEALLSVLGSVIEGVDPIRAMGAPGSWGYGTPIGDALLAVIQSS